MNLILLVFDRRMLVSFHGKSRWISFTGGSKGDWASESDGPANKALLRHATRAVKRLHRPRDTSRAWKVLNREYERKRERVLKKLYRILRGIYNYLISILIEEYVIHPLIIVFPVLKIRNFKEFVVKLYIQINRSKYKMMSTIQCVENNVKTCVCVCVG